MDFLRTDVDQAVEFSARLFRGQTIPHLSLARWIKETWTTATLQGQNPGIYLFPLHERVKLMLPQIDSYARSADRAWEQEPHNVKMQIVFASVMAAATHPPMELIGAWYVLENRLMPPPPIVPRRI